MIVHAKKKNTPIVTILEIPRITIPPQQSSQLYYNSDECFLDEKLVLIPDLKPSNLLWPSAGSIIGSYGKSR
ncbi:hypothetical protein HY230_02470 [Candidatus Acetothermia bacterium]|nr:hypothetical protein [Candidatus Acetothermia bacterium]